MDKLKKFCLNYGLDIIGITFVILVSNIVLVHGDLTTYVVSPMHIVDNGLFTNDFAAMAFAESFNSQLFPDLLYAFFLKLGLSFTEVAFIYIMGTSILFGVGIIAISKHFAKDKSYILSTLIMLFAISLVSGKYIGGHPVWVTGAYHSQISFGIGVLAFYYALKEKFNISFILLALATLMHLLVGVYCAAFCAVFLAIYVIKNKCYKKLWCVIPWVITCLAIFLLMYIDGSTSTNEMTSDLFLKIHVHFRHPHSHKLSTWGSVHWIDFGLLIAGIFILLIACKDYTKHFKKIITIFFASTLFTAIMLLIGYVFVEVIPITFIAKIQPGRCVFIYRFIIEVIFAYLLYLMITNKQSLAAYILALVACTPYFGSIPNAGLYVFISSVSVLIISILKKREFTKIVKLSYVSYLIILVLWYLLIFNSERLLNEKMYSVMVTIVLIFILYNVKIVNKIGRVAKYTFICGYLVACFLGSFIDFGAISSLNLRNVPIVSLHQRVNPLVSEDIMELAQYVNDNTEKNILYLGDPFDMNTSYFRVYSKRSTVVTVKNMPFTDKGMIEWINRLQRLDCVVAGENGYFYSNNIFSQASPQQLSSYCKAFGATHLLYKANNDFNFKLFKDAGFSIVCNKGAYYFFEFTQTN